MVCQYISCSLSIFSLSTMTAWQATEPTITSLANKSLKITLPAYGPFKKSFLCLCQTVIEAYYATGAKQTFVGIYIFLKQIVSTGQGVYLTDTCSANWSLTLSFVSTYLSVLPCIDKRHAPNETCFHMHCVFTALNNGMALMHFHGVFTCNARYRNCLKF